MTGDLASFTWSVVTTCRRQLSNSLESAFDPCVLLMLSKLYEACEFLAIVADFNIASIIFLDLQVLAVDVN